MPSVLVNSTAFQPMDLIDKEETKKLQNENATTDFSSIRTPFVSNNVLIIVLLTMAVMFVIALCAFLYSCFHRRKVLQMRKNEGNEPNAPSRQELQEVFDFQRRAMLEPYDKANNLSDSASFRESLHRWASMKNLPRLHSSEQSALKEKQPSNYATTPRSVFPALSQKWNESSAQKIEKLRTKLIARFPSSSSHSASTSDVSVFFSASSRTSDFGESSQLSSEEENDELQKKDAGKGKSKSGSFSLRVPSIVIEFVQ